MNPARRVLGSAGGPHSRSTPLGLAVLLTPSLLLGPAFVVLMVSVHYSAEAAARIWSHIAVAFASMYATLFAAAVFRGPGLGRWIRRMLVANGCLLPFLALQMYWPPLILGRQPVGHHLPGCLRTTGGTLLVRPVMRRLQGTP